MKIICDCGNEMEFNTIDEDTGKEYELDDEGQYVTIDHDKFGSWAEHDKAGWACRSCTKAIWYFA